MYGVGCFWNNYIAHVPLIAHGIRIVEMSNREQRSVEMTSMNLQLSILSQEDRGVAQMVTPL